MQDLHHLATAELVDLLANYTSNYTQMLTKGYKGEELNTCEHVINFLQAEINERKQPQPNSIPSFAKYPQSKH